MPRTMTIYRPGNPPQKAEMFTISAREAMRNDPNWTTSPIEGAVEKIPIAETQEPGTGEPIDSGLPEPAAIEDPKALRAADVYMPPEGGDDLTKVKGIGPALAKKLNAQGITTFEQLATLTDDEREKLSDDMKLYGTFRLRPTLSEQATKLADARPAVGPFGSAPAPEPIVPEIEEDDTDV